MKMYDEQVIRKLHYALLCDQFDDVAKHEAMGCVHPDVVLEFVRRNASEDILEVGCGSGEAFALLPIVAAVDVNPGRIIRARKAGRRDVIVKQACAEALPFRDKSYGTVLHMQGFFQVRSDWEALVEYNRVLRMGGRFIFDFPGRNCPVVFGRVLDARGYIKCLLDFGFELVERREFTDGFEALAMEKVEDFDYKKLLKPQLVPSGIRGMFKVNNMPEGLVLL